MTPPTWRGSPGPCTCVPLYSAPTSSQRPDGEHLTVNCKLRLLSAQAPEASAVHTSPCARCHITSKSSIAHHCCFQRRAQPIPEKTIGLRIRVSLENVGNSSKKHTRAVAMHVFTVEPIGSRAIGRSDPRFPCHVHSHVD